MLRRISHEFKTIPKMLKFYTNLNDLDLSELIIYTLGWALANATMVLNIKYGNYVVAGLCASLGYMMTRWYYEINKDENK